MNKNVAKQIAIGKQPFGTYISSSRKKLDEIKSGGVIMEIVSCDNSACPYWKDDYFCLTDKSAHCPVYEGQEMLDGYCSDFTSSNKEYTEPNCSANQQS